jgi:hypothetical protein
MNISIPNMPIIKGSTTGMYLNIKLYSITKSALSYDRQRSFAKLTRYDTSHKENGRSKKVKNANKTKDKKIFQQRLFLLLIKGKIIGCLPLKPGL